MSDELKMTCQRSLPGGKLDDSTYEQIEDALDKIEAPMTENGRWLTLVERILALGAPSEASSETAAQSQSNRHGGEDR